MIKRVKIEGRQSTRSIKKKANNPSRDSAQFGKRTSKVINKTKKLTKSRNITKFHDGEEGRSGMKKRRDVGNQSRSTLLRNESIDSRVQKSVHSLTPETDPESLRRLLGLYREGYSLPYIARYKRNVIGDMSESALRLVDQNYHNILNTESSRAKAITRVLETVDVEMVSSAIVNQLELATTKSEIQNIVSSVIRQDPNSKVCRLQAALADQNAVDLGTSVLGCLSNRCSHLTLIPETLRLNASLVIGSRLFGDEDIVKLVRTIADRNNRSELDKIKSHTWMALKREGKATSSMFTITNPQMTELLMAIHKAVVPPTSETQSISGKLSLDTKSCLKFFLESVQRGLDDLIIPSIKSEWLQYLNRRSETDAVEYFRKNLRQKLLQPPPPIMQSSPIILGIDPGLSSGCKAVLLDGDKIVKHFKFNPSPEIKMNVDSLRDHLSGYTSKNFIVALGNGTGSFECRRFLSAIIPDVLVAIVDESGASYYSVSELAMAELPQLSLEYRGAVSIARRLCDPLSEYVKIDPHRLSVGMYQHDIAEKKLEKFLQDIVRECIADVGVDVNTASESLLRFVPGLNRKTAKAIVDFRESHGIHNRADIQKIHGIGPITYKHCIGFLQVKNSTWTPLDSTAVHPDDYTIANQVVQQHPELAQYWSGGVVIPTPVLYEPDDEERILQLLRLSDPRELYEPIEIRTAREWVESLDKTGIKEGAVLNGIVRNITAFGAFVELLHAAAKDQGLLHISNYPLGVQDPHYYNINQSIKVKILSIEDALGSGEKGRKVRISLSARL